MLTVSNPHNPHNPHFNPHAGCNPHNRGQPRSPVGERVGGAGWNLRVEQPNSTNSTRTALTRGYLTPAARTSAPPPHGGPGVRNWAPGNRRGRWSWHPRGTVNSVRHGNPRRGATSRVALSELWLIGRLYA